jgi:hypothetical protein
LVPHPTFYHFQLPTNKGSINESIHQLGQSSHDPITSQWLDLPARVQTFSRWAFSRTLYI